MFSFDRYDWEEIIRARTFVALQDTAAFHGIDWTPSEAALTNFRNIAKIMLHSRAFDALARRASGQLREGEVELTDAERDYFDNVRFDNPEIKRTPRRIRPVVLKRFADLNEQGSKAGTVTGLVRETLIPIGLVHEDKARDGSKVIYSASDAMMALVNAINTDQPFDPAPFFTKAKQKRRPGNLEAFPWEEK